MHMSSAFPGGRPPEQPGEYVGEYKGMDWMNAPGEGKNHDVVLSSGRGWGNCKLCKIADGNQGDVTGIYLKKGFIKGEALRLLELRACLYGGRGPRVGEVTHLGGVTPPVSRISYFNLITFT